MSSTTSASTSSIDQWQEIPNKTPGYFLGSLPVEKFTSLFFPGVAQHQVRVSNRAFSRVLNKGAKGRNPTVNGQPIDRFVLAAQRFLPSFTVCTGGSNPDSLCGLKVDIAVYRGSVSRKEATDFTEMDIFIQFEPSKSKVPFLDDPHSYYHWEVNQKYHFEKITGSARVWREKFAQRLSALSMMSQFRTHCFAVGIFGRRARLFCWDTAGVVVTEAFDYTKANTLARFFRIFNNSDASERGHDTSVSRLDNPWPTHLAPRADLEDLIRRNHWDFSAPLYRHFSVMKIPDRDDPTLERDVVISCPLLVDLDAPFGCTTRRLFAYDVKLPKIVFVKQYWRCLSVTHKKEGDVYKILSDKNVRHLPVFGCGNDVRDYQTKTGDVEASSDGSWTPHPTRTFNKYRLYRMSLETNGERLTWFKSTRELVTAVRDAQICHDDAYFKAGILHTDISSNNIMINGSDGSGFLADWELSLDLNVGNPPPFERRGTWQFISFSSLLSRGEASPRLVDDRESFFWVLRWVCLLYVPHTSNTPMSEWLEMFNEEIIDYDRGKKWGGCRKRSFLRDFNHVGLTFDERPVLWELLRSIGRILRWPLVPLYEVRERYPWTNSFLFELEASLHDPERDEEIRRATVALQEQEGYMVNVFNALLKDPLGWSEADDPATLNRYFLGETAEHTHDSDASQSSLAGSTA